MKDRIERAAAFIKQNLPESPKIGLILGSGLGILADEIENPVKLKYEDIPEFPVSTVEGHAGQLVLGTLKEFPSLQCRAAFIFMKATQWRKSHSLYA